MTRPILKLDSPDPEPAPSGTPRGRWVVLGIAIAALFTGVALTMLKILPRPHSRYDYLIAGGVATMVTMLAIFGALLASILPISDPFFRRRRK